MFHRRLKIMIGALVLVLGVLSARLAQIQLLNAERYQQEVLRALDRPGRLLESVRGTIRDSRQRILAVDRPAFHLCLHYDFTRLYDERFWRMQAVRRADANGDIRRSAVRSYLRNEFHLADTEIQNLLAAYPGEQPVPLAAIRGAVLDKANQLLDELAETCELDPHSLFAAVEEINDRVFYRRLARARRIYYDNHADLDFQPTASLTELVADFERLIPDADLRFRRISEADIVEMHQAHTAFENLPEDVARAVEAGFVGAFSAGAAQPRPVTIRFGRIRRYPYHDVACHLIGQLRRTDPDPCAAENVTSNPTEEWLFAYRSDDRTGHWGVEYAFETQLRGYRGWIRRDVENRIIENIEPRFGQDITLTIDIELQQDLQELLESYGYLGAIVIIDVPTAAVRAMVSTPTFDLNTFYQAEQFRTVTLEMADLYWTNRAIAHNYEPGSSSKPATLLAALELGLVTTNTPIYCPPRDPTKPPPQCWSTYGHGDTLPERAIYESCNTYFIQIADMCAPPDYLGWLRRQGYGRPILAWPNFVAERAGFAFRETAGHLHAPSRSALRVLSIGRGGFDGSPLQVANSMATIARNGVFVPPTIVATPAPPQPPERIITRPEHINLLHEAMRETIHHPRGTAHEAFKPVPWRESEVVLYGKTGSTGHALFAGFAKAADGRSLALTLLVEGDGSGDFGGGDMAAPLGRAALLIASRHGYLPKPTIAAVSDYLH